MRCRNCGLSDSDVLVQDPKGRWICYECRLKELGRSGYERHHPLGRKAYPDIVIEIPANLHRKLEALRSRLPIRWEPDLPWAFFELILISPHPLLLVFWLFLIMIHAWKEDPQWLDLSQIRLNHEV